MRKITLTASMLCLGLNLPQTLLAEIGINPTAVPSPYTTPSPAQPLDPAVPSPADNKVEPPPAPATPAKPTETVTTPAPENKATANAAADDGSLREKIKDAVVKVHIVQHSYDILSPWNSDSNKGSGSGLLIEGNLILTNAHVAADATFIEVQRHGETKRHEAEVVAISHESDLALLRTKDPNVYKGIKPLELGDLPKMQQKVEVYGFPIGGNTLSVTSGVVSRIEKQNYVHTGENLIAIQVDAAINFGNSGGPVISDGKVVGVAMQSTFMTENIGYMIPVPIIRHVLNDYKDGKMDGYGFHGFSAQSMENPAMRRKYRLTDDQTGVLVHKIYKGSPAEGKVQQGDIVTHIDGHKIENNGTVEFRPGEYIDYTHYIDLHQIGENVTFKLLRNGQPLEVSLHLEKPGKEYLLVKPNEYDKQPSYFIFGGFVFMPLNQDLMDSMERLPARIGALSYESPDEKRREAVIMTKVLPADINKDYHHDNNLLIETVNGERFPDFKAFYQKIQSSQDEFIVLGTADDYQIVIDRKEAMAAQPAILARYGISEDRSNDLQALATNHGQTPAPTASNGGKPAVPAAAQPSPDMKPAATQPPATQQEQTGQPATTPAAGGKQP